MMKLSEIITNRSGNQPIVKILVICAEQDLDMMKPQCDELWETQVIPTILKTAKVVNFPSDVSVPSQTVRVRPGYPIIVATHDTNEITVWNYQSYNS